MNSILLLCEDIFVSSFIREQHSYKNKLVSAFIAILAILLDHSTLKTVIIKHKTMESHEMPVLYIDLIISTSSGFVE